MRENACVTAATNDDDDDSVVKMEERVLEETFQERHIGSFFIQIGVASLHVS